MTTKKNSPVSRIDPLFEKQMREAALVRVNKGFAKLSPKEISIPEMTKLVTRTESWKGVLFELQNKPKKENIKV